MYRILEILEDIGLILMMITLIIAMLCFITLLIILIIGMCNIDYWVDKLLAG